MTDGTFFSRAWPSIVALVGTVAVVFGLLFVFGDDDGGSSDDPSTGDITDEDTGDNLDDTGDAAPADGTTDDPLGEDGDPAEEGSDGDGATEDPAAPPAEPVEAPPELRTPVGILNATDVAGLAAGAQERFVDGGWDVPATTNYSGELEGTTVYYPTEDLRASAEALQAQFPEIRFVEPTIGGLATDRLIVVLADDYAEAVGAIESGGG